MALKQLTTSIAIVGTILTSGIFASYPALALNIVSGSISGTWEGKYLPISDELLTAGDTFIAEYTYDTDSVTTSGYSFPNGQTGTFNSASLLSLVFNSGSVAYAFDTSNWFSSISWSRNDDGPFAGGGFSQSTSLFAADFTASGSNYFDAYRTLGEYNGTAYANSGANAYAYNSSTRSYLYAVTAYNAVFSGNPGLLPPPVPPTQSIPIPALLPGLIGFGLSLCRKRRQMEGEVRAAEMIEI